MTVAFNPEALYVALDKRRRAAHLHWRDIAAESHVSASTFTRLGLHGHAPSADNLARMLAWLGETDLAPYMTTDVTGEEPTP